MASVAMPASALGALGTLPLELRHHIYRQLLVSHHASNTFGSGSGIACNILCLSSTIHAEARPLLYSPPNRIGHVLENAATSSCQFAGSPFALIPRLAVFRMPRLTVRLTFRTLNRGECEQEILGIYYLLQFAESLALALQHSQCLRKLDIELLNENQRKRGRKLVRSQLLRNQICNILRLFANLDRGVLISVGGFDTIDYVELWNDLRSKRSGKRIPLESMMAEILT